MAIRVIPTIVAKNCSADLEQEASRLVRVLFPENLKRLGKSRMVSVSRARQDGGALRATAEMLLEAHALGATPDELLRVIVWLRSFVDSLRKEVDGSLEGLREASIAETRVQSLQDPVQAIVTAGDLTYVPELIERTIELIATQHRLVDAARGLEAA